MCSANYPVQCCLLCGCLTVSLHNTCGRTTRARDTQYHKVTEESKEAEQRAFVREAPCGIGLCHPVVTAALMRWGWPDPNKGSLSLSNYKLEPEPSSLENAVGDEDAQCTPVIKRNIKDAWGESLEELDQDVEKAMPDSREKDVFGETRMKVKAKANARERDRGKREEETTAKTSNMSAKGYGELLAALQKVL